MRYLLLLTFNKLLDGLAFVENHLLILKRKSIIVWFKVCLAFDIGIEGLE
jgi:hypothetical protein